MSTPHIADLGLRSRLKHVGLAAVVFIALLPAGLARAEDPVGGPGNAAPALGAPPVFQGGADEFLAPVSNGGPQEWLTALHGQLLRLKTPPPRSSQDAQLHSAWESILEHRIATMLGRLEKWQDNARWVVVDGEPGQTVLKQDQWPGFVQSMAFLAAELHGAWKQYQNVQIKRKNVTVDRPRYLAGPYTGRLSYPVSGLYQSILQRQAAARQLGFVRGGSHWHLLGRFRTAWDWSWDQSSTWARYLERKETQEARENLEHALQVALDGTRDTLSNTLLGLQAFVAAVQDAEQDRLRSICLACRTDDATLREMAETALRDMELVQMEAERYQGLSYSEYGTRLRTWSRRQRAAVSVLDITEKRLADDGAEEAGEAPPAPPAAR